jgi:hypothetical protein
MKKKIVISLVFLLFAFAVQAQSAWSGFFKPVNGNIFNQPRKMLVKYNNNVSLKLTDTVVVMPSAWKVRPAVNLIKQQ